MQGAACTSTLALVPLPHAALSPFPPVPSQGLSSPKEVQLGQW